MSSSDIYIYKDKHTWTEFRAILQRWLENSGGYGPCGLEKADLLGDISESTDANRVAILKEVLATMEILWPEPKFD